MPRPTMNVNGPHYQALLKGREMHRLYGADYQDMMWAEKTLARLAARSADVGYNDRDRDDVRKIKEIQKRVFAGKNYDPNQPRVPAGNSDGGEWTNTGRSGVRPARTALPTRKPPSMRKPKTPFYPPLTPTELQRFNRRAPRGTRPEDLVIDPITGLPRWYAGGGVSPTTSPLDFIGAGSAARAAGSIAKTTAVEAAATVRVLRARIMGKREAEESVAKIRKAADAVEEFLGGRPDPKNVKINPKGDIIIIKDNRKFRMDVHSPGNKPGPQGSRLPENPHFHLLERRNGKWKDATDIHRYYFIKE